MDGTDIELFSLQFLEYGLLLIGQQCDGFVLRSDLIASCFFLRFCRACSSRNFADLLETAPSHLRPVSSARFFSFTF